jgi:glycosyltransferase involved in cell wall biosynthesis
MRKKIIFNGLTFDEANVIPIALKINNFQKFGCDITIFGNENLEKKINVTGILQNYRLLKFSRKIQTRGKINFLFESIFRNILAIKYIRKVRGKYDVIYSFSVLDSILFPFILKIFDKKIKWVAVFDNVVPLSDPGNKIIRFLAWIFFKISLKLLKRADRIFVISDDLEKFMLQKGFKREKIILSTNGVENDLIKKAEVDEKYNIDALFLGRINETKGIYDMLEVLNIVRGKYPDFQLVIMGEGDETTKHQFKRRIKNMDLENNVQFLGFRTGQEKFNIIKSAKCFWFLSVSGSESFGVALLEAVCSGIPAFAYDLPQFSRIYQNGEIDISPKSDYKLVAQKVIKLFENGNFSNERGKMFLDKYSWEHVAEIEYNAIRSL